MHHSCWFIVPLVERLQHPQRHSCKSTMLLHAIQLATMDPLDDDEAAADASEANPSAQPGRAINLVDVPEDEEVTDTTAPAVLPPLAEIFYDVEHFLKLAARNASLLHCLESSPVVIPSDYIINNS